MAVRSRAIAAAVPLLLLSAACSGSPARPHPTPSLPIRTGGAHPGASELTPAAPTTPFAPSLTRAAADVPSYWTRCQARHTTVVVQCVLGYRKSKPKKVIALVGDSATAGWMDPLDAIGRARHWKIITMLHTLCTWTAARILQVPTITAHGRVPNGPNTECHIWGARAQHRLLTETKPDVVISTDRAHVYTAAAPLGGPKAVVAVGRGLATYWRQLLAHHIAVVGLRETPEPGRNVPVCLERRSVRSCSTPRAIADEPTTPVTVAARAVHGERLIDLNDLMCTATLCPPIVGNVLVYRDVHHLTRTFARTMAPYLERRLLTVPALARG